MSNMDLSLGASIAVIGAGIVGVASAHELARRGYDVVVYDPAPPGEAGPSRANAGHIAASDIHPLSTPRIHWKAIKMLMNRDGALKIPIRDAFAHAPWFWRFWRTSQGKRFETATKALSYLSRCSLTDTSLMLESADMTDMLQYKGCAFLYDTKESVIANKRVWDGKTARGISSEEMDIERIAREIPIIANKFCQGVLTHEWAIVRDPLDVVRGLAKAAESNGVIFQRQRVNQIFARDDTVDLETANRKYQFNAVIIAAGVNSAAFAKSCGEFLPRALYS